jgi:uncharacterized protein YkwD
MRRCASLVMLFGVVAAGCSASGTSSTGGYGGGICDGASGCYAGGAAGQGGSGQGGTGSQSGNGGVSGSSSSGGAGTGGAGAGGPAACGDPGGWDPQWASMECEVLRITNERRAQGATCGGQPFGPAPPLEFDAELRQSARGHAQDMGTNGFFSHTNLQGQSFADRIRQAGYGGSPIGENIAAGQSSPAAVMNTWMDSPGHCENIMNPDYRFLGVGFYFAPNSEFGEYWVQNFGG